MLYPIRNIDLIQAPPFRGKLATFKSKVKQKFPGLKLVHEGQNGIHASSLAFESIIKQGSSRENQLNENLAEKAFQRICREAGLKLNYFTFYKGNSENGVRIYIKTTVMAEGLSGSERGNIDPYGKLKN